MKAGLELRLGDYKAPSSVGCDPHHVSEITSSLYGKCISVRHFSHKSYTKRDKLSSSAAAQGHFHILLLLADLMIH